MSFHPEHFTVWAEIPVTDLKKSREFYESVLQTQLDWREDMGPDPIAVFKTSNEKHGVAGHLYKGKPAPAGTGPTVHLAVPDKLEDAMERFVSGGGTIVSDPVPIPAGRFAYGEDLDGNSIGLFQYG